MSDRYREYQNIYGEIYEPTPDTSGMTIPVRCTHCPGVYDLGTVTVTARYTDCSMWRSPCCDLLVDDRGETGWKSRGDYVRLRRADASREAE